MPHRITVSAVSFAFFFLQSGNKVEICKPRGGSDEEIHGGES